MPEEKTNNAVTDPWKVAMSKTVLRLCQVAASIDHNAFKDIDFTPIVEMAKMEP
jgi:hypothetical protein